MNLPARWHCLCSSTQWHPWLQGSFCQTPMEQAALAFLPSAKTAEDVRETVTGDALQCTCMAAFDSVPTSSHANALHTHGFETGQQEAIGVQQSFGEVKWGCSTHPHACSAAGPGPVHRGGDG